MYFEFIFDFLEAFEYTYFTANINELASIVFSNIREKQYLQL
jgi:hypothetical protein